MSAAINREIRTAYLQLGFVCLFVLLGALIAAEKLIIKPIEMMAGMAKRFGEGDWSARVGAQPLPAEFVPLARAFNAMAAQLGQRERELVATNDRLTVMASIDMLSGLANRRGFQSRLDFEWMKAQQYDSELSLLMIDVDHFKLLQRHLWPSRRRRLPHQARRNAVRHRRRDHGLCRPLWRRGILPVAAEHRALKRARDRRDGARRGAEPRAAARHLQPSDRHRQRRRRRNAPNDTQRPGDLIEAADAALYAAKHRGRNTVVEHGFVRMIDEAGMALAG